MYKFKVNDTTSYEVVIGNDIFKDELKKITLNYNNVFFFIDNKVKVDIDSPNVYYFDVDEKMKTINTYQQIIEQLLADKVPRENTVFVTIGGGVLLDIIGFVASTYKRGVSLVNVPTTLLSQVDVAIGSKTGINIGNFKNMIGTFYPPVISIVDTSFLLTLDERNYNNGMAEVIKYGCIKDASIISDLEQDIYDINEVIYKSLMCKKYFVENDPKDHGIRQVLNFGHTYGHAIESYYDYDKYLHGEAVSIGMNIKFDNDRLKALCMKFALPITIEDDVLDKLDMKNDKKAGTRKNIFINIDDFGKFRLE